jgi:hypothetical protein
VGVGAELREPLRRQVHRAAQDEYANPVEVLVLADCLERREPAVARHVHVENQQIGAGRCDLVEDGLRVSRLPDLVAALGEQLDDELPHLLVVIRDQNAVRQNASPFVSARIAQGDTGSRRYA